MSDDAGAGLSRRPVVAAGLAGLVTASAATSARGGARGRPAANGTPEQIHLTWGDDPAHGVVVSWVSPGRAERPRVRIGQRVITAVEHGYTDSLSGIVTWTYHARVNGLRPGATYGYAVTADNDANAADPFSATFTAAPAGRAAFRFTSFGDLTAPGDAVADSWQVASAAGAVEAFQPLFHLLNDGVPGRARERDRRDFANAVQASAANRPWLPVPGDHDPRPVADGPGPAHLTRYALPSNGTDGEAGCWYAFRIGTALFVCLNGDAAAYPGPAPQARRLEPVLAAARADASVDWIVVQIRPARSPAAAGPDLGVGPEWRRLFDTYEVDLVLSGRGRGYQRSFPVRGLDHGTVAEGRGGAVAGPGLPHPVTTVDSGVFDTSHGTVHMVLGRGGAGTAGPGTGLALGSSGPARAVPDQWRRARRDTSAGHGIAVFDLSPGSEAGGHTSVTVRYFRAAAADQPDPPGDYALLESFTLVRPRSDGRRWHRR